MPDLDYTKFHEKGKKRKKGPEGHAGEANQRWWELKGQEAADSISSVLGTLGDNQDMRIRQMLVSTRLYGNLSTLGVNGVSFSKMAASHPALREKISFNVVQSAVDTIISKTVKNKPKPFFLTSGGDSKMQRRAKKLNKFIEGLFYNQKAYIHGRRAMRDGCVWGDGLTHVFARNERVNYERVLSHEMWVDEAEAYYGEPRSMHRGKNVDRDVLMAAWPKFAEEIKRATKARPDPTGINSVSDLVTVRESWHLPSGEDATDGRHMITIDKTVLFEEQYEKQFFPFARFCWWERQHGYFGQGLAEQIQHIQLEINKLLTLVQRSFHMGGSFKVLLEMGSKVVKEHLTNDVGALVMYSGTKPEYVVPPLVPPEVYGHLKTLRDAAFEQAGISQLSATSRLPEGVESGKAMREYNNIETERFTAVGHAYEQFYLDLAHLSIECAKDIAKKHKGHYRVTVPGRKFLQTVDWADIDLENDMYVMQCFPISSLPSDPTGRLQTVQEYIAAGFVTKRQGKKLLDFPDLEMQDALQSAAEDYITEMLDKVVDDGEPFVPPEPYDDIKLYREMALEYYQRGKTQGLEEERLDELRRLLAQLDYLLAKQMAAAQPPVGGPPAAPPQAVPPSPLVPQQGAQPAA